MYQSIYVPESFEREECGMKISNKTQARTSPFIIIIFAIKSYLISFWKVYSRNLKVVLRLSRRMCSKKKTVDGVGFVRRAETERVYKTI